MVVITLQYTNVLNQCVVYLRLAQCYMSNVSTKKRE